MTKPTIERLFRNLATVSPSIGEEFANAEDFYEALEDAATLIRGEDASQRLAAVLGDVVVFNVDAEAAMAQFDPHDFGTPDEADDEENEEEQD